MAVNGVSSCFQQIVSHLASLLIGVKHCSTGHCFAWLAHGGYEIFAAGDATLIDCKLKMTGDLGCPASSSGLSKHPSGHDLPLVMQASQRLLHPSSRSSTLDRRCGCSSSGCGTGQHTCQMSCLQAPNHPRTPQRLLQQLHQQSIQLSRCL